MDVSVIIVSWNCADFLVSCLKSLPGGMVGVKGEVFVVDNASTDGSAGLVREQFPTVRLIANTDNRGFAAANNQAVEQSCGRYLLFLNPDTELSSGALAAWTQFMDEHQDCAVSGCRLLNSDGTHQPSVRAFPGFAMAFARYTPLKYVPFFGAWKRRYRPEAVDFQAPEPVEQVSGAAIFVRRAEFPGRKVFDERFFIFFEEVDLCRRARLAGREVMYFPGAQITHHGGKSRRHMKTRINAIQLRSMLAYLRKHNPAGRFALLNAVFKPLFVVQLFLDILFGLPEHLWRRAFRPDKAGRDSFLRKCAFVREHLADFIWRF